MANTINWGKIYESTYWGNTDNNISWGKAYADLAGVVPALVSEFVSRVEADGGSVESTECMSTDLTFLVNNPEPVDFTGLLNDYSGAAAAYSLRLLDNTYSGNAIKVRRSSDNAEQDIAFVNNELDTASLETFAGAGDAFVTTWYDQSGSGNDATQTTAASQPKIVSSGSTILDNGNPSLEFSSNQDIEVSDLVNDDQASFSLFGIGSFDSLSGEGVFFCATAEAANFRYALSYNRAGGGKFANRVWLEGTAYNSGSDSALSPSNQYLFSSVQTNFYIDSVANTTANAGRLQAFGDSFQIGSRQGVYYHDGKVSEVVVYLSDESTNRTGIETNINDFYSIY